MAVAAFAVSAQEFASFADMQKAGQAAEKAKDYEKMRVIYGAWYKKATSDYQKWVCVFGETKALRQMEKYDDALKIIDDFIATKPNASDWAMSLFVKGLVFLSKGDINTSIKFLEESLAMQKLPGYAIEQAYRRLAELYYRTKQYDKCIDASKKVLDNPKWYREETYYWYASSLFDLGKNDDCEKILKDALPVVKQKMLRQQIVYFYAQLLLKQDNEDDAVKYLKETVELIPKSWRADAAKKILAEFE